MKRRPFLLVAVLLPVALAALWLAARLREPRAQGRSLSQWMEEYELSLNPPGSFNAPDHRRADRAIAALREMGPAGVQALMRRMAERDPAWKLTLLEWSRKQSLIRIDHEPAEHRRHWAVSALCDLGPSASVALPRLATWLGDPEFPEDASRVMASIGPASLSVLTASLAHRNERTRRLAAQALGWLGRDASPAVPVLLASLLQTNALPRSAVIRSLGAIGAPRKEIETQLTGLLRQPADTFDAACGLAKLGGDSLLPLMLALTNSEPKVLVAGLAGLNFWHEINKRPAPTEVREVRQRVQRLDTLFNLKAIGMGFAGRSRSPDPVIARTLTLTLTNTDASASLRALSAEMLSRFPGGTQFSIPALHVALDDADASVRQAARNSLERLPASPASTNALPLSRLPTPAQP